MCQSAPCLRSRLHTAATCILFLSGFLAESARAQAPPQLPDSLRDVRVDLSTADKRDETVRLLRERSTARLQIAEAIAKARGWKLRGSTPQGEIFELVGLDDNGHPEYVISNNTNAAISTNVHLLRQVAPFNLDGSGWKIGLWEAGGVPRITHQEFSGRITLIDNVGASSHATHVAGTLIATGIDAQAKGMAPLATIDAYDATSDESEMAGAAASAPGQAGRVTISNHSYGTVTGWVYSSYSGNVGWHWFGSIANREDDTFGQYGSTTRLWDDVCYNAPYFLPFKSAGNDRNDDAPSDGTTFYYLNGGWVSKAYDSATDPFDDGHDQGGFDTIPSYGNAKNIMCVGAANDAVSGGNRSVVNSTITSFSGWGPTDDGRIKPDIVANGASLYSSTSTSDSSYGNSNGTSMSSPNAAGSALLLQEYYDERTSGDQMRASTLKALIIHTADDLGRSGPDYSYGWGLMNAKAAADVITAHTDGPAMTGLTHTGNLFEDTVSSAQPEVIFDVFSDGLEPLVATLCWTDPAGSSTSGFDIPTIRLVNDLDVQIERVSDSQQFQPYVLDPANPLNVATTGDNIRDNVEQVRLASPSAGAYRIRVNHKGTITTGSQVFSLVITGNAEPPDLPDPADLTSASDTGSSSSDNITSDDTPSFTGTSDPGASIVLSSDRDGIVGNGTASGSGDWTITASTLSDGIHEITYTANDGSDSIPLSVTIDTAAPAAPSSLDLAASSDSGSSDTDNITRVANPRILGNAESGTSVSLFLDNTAAASGTANAAGFDLTVAGVTEGTRQFTATATDIAGNTSALSSALSVTFDFTAPPVPGVPDLAAASDSGISNTDNLTNVFTPTFTGTGSNGFEVDLLIDGVLSGTATVSGGWWTIVSTGISEGVRSVVARQRDVAGNQSGDSGALMVTADRTGPGRPTNFTLDPASDTGFSDTDGLTSDTTPTFHGDTEPGARLQLFRATTVPVATGVGGAGFSLTTSPLPPGTHTITARSFDDAGNQGLTTPGITIEIETTPPFQVFNLSLDPASDTGFSNTDRITKETTLRVKGLSLPHDGGTRLHLLLDGVDVFQQDVEGNWMADLPPQSDGPVTITARNEDVAGNLSPPTEIEVLIDTTPPAAPAQLGLTPETDTGISNSDAITNDTSPVITGSAEPGEVEVFQNGNSLGLVASDGTWEIPVANLPEGITTFSARQRDLAGNLGPMSASLEVTVDLTPPSPPTAPVLAPGSDTGIDATDGLTMLPTPAFSGDSEAGTVVFLYDESDTVIGQGIANSPWNAVVDPLPDGQHTISAAASDVAGNLSERTATTSFTVDATPPTVAIDQAPDQEDSTLDPTVSFMAVFGEPVTGLSPGAIDFISTLSIGNVGLVADPDGMTHHISADLGPGEGPVTATLPAGVAMDAAGNANLASTSTDNSVTKKEIPGPVAGVNATDGDFPDKVVVTWTDSGASTYRIFRHPFRNPSAATEIGSVGAGAANFEDAGAVPDLSYFYWVRAEDEDGVGEFGAPDSGFADSGSASNKTAETPLAEADAPDADPLATWNDEAAGVYDGLLRDAEDGYTIVGGVNRLVISRAGNRPGLGGSLSGSVKFDGRTAVIRGTLDDSGHLQDDIRQRDGSVLSVDLQVHRTTTAGRENETLRGSLIWGDITAVVDFPRAPFHPRLNPAPDEWTGSFTMIVPALPGTDNTLQPGGDGWATVNLNAGGKARVAGVLGDGTRFTESACLSPEGDFSLYTWLYRPVEGERGSLGVRLVFRDHAPDISDFDGVAQWHKPADTREKRYPDGFLVEAWTLGCRYDRPDRGERSLATLEEQYHNACLALEGTGGPEGGALERAVTWMTNDRISYYGPERASALVRTANGSLVGSWFDPETRSRWPFAGVVFQAQQIVAGHFLAAETTGSLVIKPSLDTPYPGSEDAGGTDRPTVPDPPAPGPDLTNLAWDSSAAGSYGGVTLMAQPTGGLLNLRVTRTGVISGVFEIDGERRSFRGGFDTNGTASFPVIRRGTTDGTLSLQLARATAIPDDSFQVAGTITLDGVVHQLDAQRRPGFQRNDRCPQEGAYNLAMRAPDGVDPAVEPAGDGCGSLRVNFLGNASGLFFLADGSRTSMSGHVSRSGEWAIYRPLFGGRGRGFLAGILTFRGTAGDPSQVDGEWRWEKAAGVSPATYPGGIATTRGVVGNAWTPPARGDRALPGLADDDFNAWARFLGPGLDAQPAIDFAVTWADNNRVTYHGPERLILSVNARTGQVNGRLIDRTNGINFRFKGIVLPNQGLATGAYTADGESGLFSMEAR